MDSRTRDRVRAVQLHRLRLAVGQALDIERSSQHRFIPISAARHRTGTPSFGPCGPEQGGLEFLLSPKHVERLTRCRFSVLDAAGLLVPTPAHGEDFPRGSWSPLDPPGARVELILVGPWEACGLLSTADGSSAHGARGRGRTARRTC